MSDAENQRWKSFELLRNPFLLLRIRPTTPLEEISNAVEDAISDAVNPEAIIYAARDTLLNPRLRLAAELSFILDTPPAHVDHLVAVLRGRPSAEILLKEADKLAPLSKSNILANCASNSPASADVLFSLIEAHSRIEIQAITRKLGICRRQAKFVEATIGAITEELDTLLITHSEAAFTGYRDTHDAAHPIRECTRRVLALSDTELTEALARFLGAYGRFIAPELNRIEDRVRTVLRSLKSKAATSAEIDELSESLKDSWSRRFELYSPIADACPKVTKYS